MDICRCHRLCHCFLLLFMAFFFCLLHCVHIRLPSIKKMNIIQRYDETVFHIVLIAGCCHDVYVSRGALPMCTIRRLKWTLYSGGLDSVNNITFHRRFDNGNFHFGTHPFLPTIFFVFSRCIVLQILLHMFSVFALFSFITI